MTEQRITVDLASWGAVPAYADSGSPFRACSDYSPRARLLANHPDLEEADIRAACAYAAAIADDRVVVLRGR